MAWLSYQKVEGMVVELQVKRLARLATDCSSWLCFNICKCHTTRHFQGQKAQKSDTLYTCVFVVSQKWIYSSCGA